MEEPEVVEEAAPEVLVDEENLMQEGMDGVTKGEKKHLDSMSLVG